MKSSQDEVMYSLAEFLPERAEHIFNDSISSFKGRDSVMEF